MHIHEYTGLLKKIYLHMHTHIYIYVCIYIHMCVYVCMCVKICFKGYEHVRDIF
jgi:hypothetical protein